MLSKAGSILIILLAAASVFSQARSFDVQKVADGVYSVIRREPATFWFNANN
jgi:hypothetical protein